MIDATANPRPSHFAAYLPVLFLSEMPPCCQQQLLGDFILWGRGRYCGKDTFWPSCAASFDLWLFQSSPWVCVRVCVCVCRHTLVWSRAGLDFKLVPVAGQCSLPNSCRHFVNDLLHILHMLKECMITCFLSLSTSTDTQLPFLPFESDSHNSGPVRYGRCCRDRCSFNLHSTLVSTADLAQNSLQPLLVCIFDIPS